MFWSPSSLVGSVKVDPGVSSLLVRFIWGRCETKRLDRSRSQGGPWFASKWTPVQLICGVKAGETTTGLQRRLPDKEASSLICADQSI